MAGILSFLMYCIVISSIIWTFLSATVLIRAHFHAKAKPVSVIKVFPTDETPLPRLNTDSVIQKLSKRLLSLATEDMNALAIDSLVNGDLMNVSFNLRISDSTYFYRFAYIKECGCPAMVTNRYEIDLKYIHPLSLEIFREDRHQGLSAEDVKRFDEPLTVERR